MVIGLSVQCPFLRLSSLGASRGPLTFCFPGLHCNYRHCSACAERRPWVWPISTLNLVISFHKAPEILLSNRQKSETNAKTIWRRLLLRHHFQSVNPLVIHESGILLLMRSI
ncbi:hypothetical protein SLA2020_321740 [Shorea laevis]